MHAFGPRSLAARTSRSPTASPYVSPFVSSRSGTGPTSMLDVSIPGASCASSEPSATPLDALASPSKSPSRSTAGIASTAPKVDASTPLERWRSAHVRLEMQRRKTGIHRMKHAPLGLGPPAQAASSYDGLRYVAT